MTDQGVPSFGGNGGNQAAAFDTFRRPNIRLNWQEAGPGPGKGEKCMASFLRQGFFLAVLNDEGDTMALTFVPRPKFKMVGDREVVEAGD